MTYHFGRKKEQPEELKALMKKYRSGETWNVPQEYIDFQKKVAEEYIYVLEDEGYMVTDTYMKNDGHGDNMKFLTVDCVDVDGNEETFMWHDSQNWYQKLSAGWGLAFMKSYKDTECETPKP